MPTQLLTLRETAERLREHEQTTRKRLRAGEIKGTRKGTGPGPAGTSPNPLWSTTSGRSRHDCYYTCPVRGVRAHHR